MQNALLKSNYIFIIGWGFLCLSCTENHSNISQNDIGKLTMAIPQVEAAIVQENNFAIEIYSNGILEAAHKTDLKFKNDGLIKNILVKNGDNVKKGQLIAEQDLEPILFEQKKNEVELSYANLEMQDILLKMGYVLSDTTPIPDKIYDMAAVRSKKTQIENQIAETALRIKNTKLTAPFSGAIADVEALAFNYSAATEKVCRLIDNNQLYATFKILEEEFHLLQIGDKVEVIPLTNTKTKFSGRVTQINPRVDDKGLIEVKALLSNHHEKLIDGMHVDIQIQKEVGKQIVIPKKAIVNRRDKKIVFTYENGKAMWHYVNPSYENKDSICILKGISPGDTIIIKGNTNLTHQLDVEIEMPNK